MGADLSQLDGLSDRFAAMPGRANAALQIRMQSSMAVLADYVQTGKLSGQVLNARSGRLRDSIAADAQQSGNATDGSVGSDLPYAAIHEYGGAILRNRLRATQIVEPERSYLRSSQSEQQNDVQTQLMAALMGAIDP